MCDESKSYAVELKSEVVHLLTFGFY